MELDNIYIKPYDEVMGNYDKDTLMKNMVFEKGYELIVDNLIATDRRLYYANELLDILKDRIDKAIEYINRCKNYHKSMHNEEKIYVDEIKELEDILRGNNE